MTKNDLALERRQVVDCLVDALVAVLHEGSARRVDCARVRDIIAEGRDAEWSAIVLAPQPSIMKEHGLKAVAGRGARSIQIREQAIRDLDRGFVVVPSDSGTAVPSDAWPILAVKAIERGFVTVAPETLPED